jgi:tetratricopeptide (TPR) repeat protein
MTAIVALVLWTAAGVAQTAEESLRAAVTEYYAALEQEDVERVLAFWTPGGEHAPDRASLVALFITGDDRYTVTIKRIAVDGDRGRVRVGVDRVRTLIRNGAAVQTFNTRTVSSLLWVHAADGAWKLTGERALAEELADLLLAAAPADRPRILQENAEDVDANVTRALASRGSRFAMARQPRQAQAAFEAALVVARAAHDRMGESEALQNLANAHYFQRQYAQALAYYQQRLELARGTQDEGGIAASEIGIATVAYTRGEYSAALASYRSALARFEAMGAEPSIATTLISVGNVQYLQAEYDAAAESYHRALGKLAASADPASEGMALSGLGRVYAAQGDLGAALDAYWRVLDSARRRADTGVIAATLESAGEVHYRLGNSDQARASFDEARRMADAQDDPSGAGRLFLDIGLTELVAGRFDAALAAYGDSRARFEKAKDADGVARAWVGVGFSQTAREKYADAIDAYKTAITAFDALDRHEASARARLGLALAQAAAGEFAASLATAGRVRAAADRLANEDLRWRAALAQGDALRQLDRPDEALRTYDEAAASAVRLLGDAPLAADVQSQLEDMGWIWAGRSAALADKHDAVGALIAEEQRRAELRRLVFAAHERDIIRSATPSERDDERQAARETISLRAQFRAAGSTGDKARLDQLRPLLAAAMTRRADLQSRLYARAPDLQAWRGLGPAPAAADLDRLVPDRRTLLVEYAVDDTEVMTFVAERGEQGITVFVARTPIKRRELVDRVNDTIAAASLHDAEEWHRRSAPLAELLLAPVRLHLTDRDRLVIVPDDVLWKVPFDALAAGDGPLIDRATIVYATSLGTLLRGAAIESNSSAAPKFGGVAAPDIPPAIRSQLALTLPGWTPVDSSTALAMTERAMGAYEEGATTLITRAAATERAARALAASVDVLQIGAPLHVSGASPLFSSILLSAPAASADPIALEDDGRWEAREWFAVEGRARTVLLTDGSAFAAPGAGRAMDALAWAATAAGVRHLIVARGAADAYDLDAALAALHERVAHGAQDPAEALHAAMLAAKRANPAPAAWAGLRIIGAR